MKNKWQTDIAIILAMLLVMTSVFPAWANENTLPGTNDSQISTQQVFHKLFAMSGETAGNTTASSVQIKINGEAADKLSFYMVRDAQTNRAELPEPVTVTVIQPEGQAIGELQISLSEKLKEKACIAITQPENLNLQVDNPVEFTVSFTDQAVADGKKSVYNSADQYISIDGLEDSGFHREIPVVYGADGLFSFYSAESAAQYEATPFLDINSGVTYALVGTVDLNKTTPPVINVQHRFDVYADMTGMDEAGNPVALSIISAKLNPDDIFRFADGSTEMAIEIGTDGLVSIPLTIEEAAFAQMRKDAVQQGETIKLYELLTQLVLVHNDGYLAGGNMNPLPLCYQVIYTPPSSSSSSDDSAFTTTTEPVSESIHTTAETDENGNAEYTLTTGSIENIIQLARDNASKKGIQTSAITAVVHIATNNSSTQKISVILPKVTQTQLIENQFDALYFVIDNPNVTIGLDLAAIKEINQQIDTDAQLTITSLTSAALSQEANQVIGSRPVFDITISAVSGAQDISNLGQGKLQVEIPYILAANETADKIQAVYVDKKGRVQWLKNTNYDPTSKSVRYSANHNSIYGIAAQTVDQFYDIANHWAKGDIDFVMQQGLFPDSKNDAFMPDAAITRGMFCTALGKLTDADVSSYTTSSFEDIPANASYLGYVEWAVNNNMIPEYENNLFAPEQAVTREQMALFLTNYANAMHLTVPSTQAAISFADENSISQETAEAVQTMQMAGILRGKENNRFDPLSTATRAETSAALHRYVKLVLQK